MTEDVNVLQTLYDRFREEPPRNDERGPWLDALWGADNWSRAVKGTVDLSSEDGPLMIAKAVTGLHAAAIVVGFKAGMGQIAPEELGKLLDVFMEDPTEMREPLRRWGPLTLQVPDHTHHMATCCSIISAGFDYTSKFGMLTCSIATAFSVFYELGKRQERARIQ